LVRTRPACRIRQRRRERCPSSDRKGPRALYDSISAKCPQQENPTRLQDDQMRAENHARECNQGGGASAAPSAFTHCTGHWYIYHWQGPLIQLYPVAEYNLEIFIDHIYESTGSESAARSVDWETRLFAEFFDKKLCLPAFFGCLSRACNISIPTLPNTWISNPKTL